MTFCINLYEKFQNCKFELATLLGINYNNKHIYKDSILHVNVRRTLTIARDGGTDRAAGVECAFRARAI